MESLNLPRLPQRYYKVLTRDTIKCMNSQTIESISINTKKINKGQMFAFNTIIGEFITGFTAQNLHAPVESPFNNKSGCSRVYCWMHFEEQRKHLLSVQYNQF